MLISLIFIHYFIIFILGCVRFQNKSDGQCTSDRFGLKCTIVNPLFRIESKNCEGKFRSMKFFMNNLTVVNQLYSTNVEAMRQFFDLFDHLNSHCEIMIKVTNFTSASDRPHLSIDKNWILKFVDGIEWRDLTFLLLFVDYNWNQTNITINSNFNQLPDKYFIRFHFTDRIRSRYCEIRSSLRTTPQKQFDDETICREFFTLIHDDSTPSLSTTTKKIIPDSTTTIESQILFTRPETTNHIPIETTSLKTRIIRSQQSSTHRMWFHPPWTTDPIPAERFTPKTTTMLNKSLIDRIWMYIFIPFIVIMVIVIGIGIYFATKGEHTIFVSQSYPQPLPPTFPTNTYATPVYHHPIY